MENILNWISAWFSSHCNGDWEHRNIVKIETLSNPGWTITIGLSDTELADLEFSIDLIETSEHDWFVHKVKDAKFIANGDLNKLEFLLNKFKEVVEANTKG